MPNPKHKISGNQTVVISLSIDLLHEAHLTKHTAHSFNYFHLFIAHPDTKSVPDSHFILGKRW